MVRADEYGIVYGKAKHDLGPCACWEEKDQLEDEEGRVQIYSPQLNVAPIPLIWVNNTFFFAFLGPLKLIPLDSIKNQAKNL